MEWVNLEEEKPPLHVIVLVKTNLHGDSWNNYFVASYFAPDKEWHMHINFKGPEPYIRIERKSLKKDQWCYIDYFEEE